MKYIIFCKRWKKMYIQLLYIKVENIEEEKAQFYYIKYELKYMK